MCAQVVSQSKSVVFKATNEEDMHLWVNVCIAQKVEIESVIDGIEFEA